MNSKIIEVINLYNRRAEYWKYRFTSNPGALKYLWNVDRLRPVSESYGEIIGMGLGKIRIMLKYNKNEIYTNI